MRDKLDGFDVVVNSFVFTFLVTYGYSRSKEKYFNNMSYKKFARFHLVCGLLGYGSIYAFEQYTNKNMARHFYDTFNK